MAEAVKNVIIISVCLGLASVIPSGAASSKYVKYVSSLVLAVCCIIPLIKSCAGLAADFPELEYEAADSRSSDLIIEKCREKLEEDIKASLCSKFGTDGGWEVSVLLNTEDIQSIIIEKVTVYTDTAVQNELEAKVKSCLSELLCMSDEQITVIRG